ncbi:MAG: orotidine-5'-phosphate decarboxylase [Synergistaceae bacterium]|jgi:orotidine-5'-phosphate decarboxylase|nr:orotidine-5'-phosphate decarboxylase [Synergistaceae bacterium]
MTAKTKQIDRLIEAIESTGNPSALGLDTRPEYLPKAVLAALPSEPERTEDDIADAVYTFNSALIDALADIVPCVKVQAAYYETLGVAGMRAFRDTLLRARSRGMVTIADVKRNDIGATAEAYAAAYLGPSAPFSADFVTLNCYLGTDGILPFLKRCELCGSGVFVLIRTSNPSAGEFQDLPSGGRPFYEYVGEKTAAWGEGEGLMGTLGYSSVGAVVGATWPEEGKRLRALLPNTFFLVPGYRAQGATARDLRGCFGGASRGGALLGGAVVNASRSLLCAHRKRGTEDFVSAARDEALRMRGELRAALAGE